MALATLDDNVTKSFLAILLLFLPYLLGPEPVLVGAESNQHDSLARPATIDDAIEMTKLADPIYWSGGVSRGLVAQFSPSGKKFVVVLRKGHLGNNTNEFSVLLWHTRQLFDPHVQPTTLFTMCSSSNRPAVHDVKWMNDDQTIQFLGENPGQLTQLYVMNTETRRLIRATSSRYNVLAYSASTRDHRVAYITDGPTHSLFDNDALREGIHISTEPLYEVLRGRTSSDDEDKQLFIQTKTVVAHRIKIHGKLEYIGVGNDVLLSPDGRYILVLVQTDDLPNSWTGYLDPDLKAEIKTRRASGQYSWIARYVVIDAETGTSRVLLNSPEKGFDTEAAWSPDSHSIVIANTLLPLEMSDGEQLEQRKSTKFAVEIDVATGQISPISSEDLRLRIWDANTNQLVFEVGRQNWQPGSIPTESFRKVGQRWEKVADIVTGANLPQIVLEEDMNTAPRIVAIDATRRKRSLLLDLNPQFKKLKFGKIEEISWTSSDGGVMKAGLYYPVDYRSGERYPLVVQTHGWMSEKFWIDGPWTTAYAAQPLAGRNIMVLQLDEFTVDGKYDWFYANKDTPAEVTRALSDYESAIDYLDKRGLIDLKHLGLMGFSRSCMYVKYALTHSKYHFAAASVTDGVDGGYWQYVANETSYPQLVSEFDGLNGGAPFGSGLVTWLRHSPGFNIDKVDTPLRIVALNPSSALSEWEWFASLTRLGKPVEMIMLEDGVHELERPWQRMVSQQGNADWFGFWLKGEDGGETSEREYEYWRRMRANDASSDKKATVVTGTQR